MSDAMLVTQEWERVRLIGRVREDLKKRAVMLSAGTIELVLDAYDTRKAKQL